MSVESRVNQCKFLCTCIYAFNNAGPREEMLTALEGIGATITSPWILLGDWNTVLTQYRGSFLYLDTREIQRFFSILSLTGLHYNGNFFT